MEETAGTVFGTEAHYRLPPAELVTLVDAPPWPALRPSPCGRRVLLVSVEGWPPLAAVAAPFARLAGLQIDVARHDRRRLQACTRFAVLDLASGRTQEIATPANSRMGAARWSPDGSHLAFPLLAGDALEIWCAEARGGRAWRVGDRHLNGVVGELEWTADSTALVALLVPRPLPPAPAPPLIPIGPRIEEAAERRATNWTYPSLLRTPHDDALLAHCFTSDPVLLDIEGRGRTLGAPDLYRRLSPSPDSSYLLVERLRQPFSRLVPWQRFAHDVAVWDWNGTLVAQLADLPAAEEVPLGGVPIGPRHVDWHPLEPAALFWVEALDDGDPRRRGTDRDRLLGWRAPFSGEPEEILRTAERLVGATWLDPSPTAPRAPHQAEPADAESVPAHGLLVTEWHRDRRWLTTRLHDVGGTAPPRVLFDRSARDDYGDPGHPLLRPRPGDATVRVEAGAIFLAGRGATPAGDRPFLDRLSLTTGEKRRLIASSEARFEQVLMRTSTAHEKEEERATPATDEPPEWLVLRESAVSPPVLLLRRDESETTLFSFPDPHPQLTRLERRLLTYRRSDGVELSAMLTLPPETTGARLPLVLWTYPIEHNEAATAAQVRSAPDRFLRLSPRSPALLALCGYAVLTDVAMPVVGDPETVNDTFVAQIVASATAAIQAAAEAGHADPERVGIGGHSYGAYTATSLLAHSRLFQAGIAESGAYNRTLTPFGFQGERRHLWDASEAYIALSPFVHANRIEAPLLLIHGELDENPGTHPMQSERLFHALQGLGKTARLVMLPGEGHGYAARESVLHVLAEWLDWLDRWVKG